MLRKIGQFLKPYQLYMLVVAVYFVFQFSVPYVFEIDGHWHIMLSKQMWERGIIYRLPELAFTIYNDYYREHHFLFQVLYMPFALLPNLHLAAKLAAAFFASLSGCFFVYLIRRYNFRYQTYWVLVFLFGSAGFLWRIELPRVQSVSLLWLLVTTFLLLEKKPKLLFLASFTYVWLYDAFFLLYPMFFVYALARFLRERKVPWRIIGFGCVGSLLGICINPYFPQNIQSYYYNIERSLITTQDIQVGGEWSSYPLYQFIFSNIILLQVYVSALFYIFQKDIRNSWSGKDKQTLVFLFGLTLIFLGLCANSRRFIEYVAPFIILFSGSVLTRLPQRDLFSLEKQKKFFLSLLCFSAITNIYYATPLKNSSEPYDCFRHAGAWARGNIPDGEVLYTTDWDDFPQLYIEAPKLRYIVGLDPLFMATHNRKLYDEWRNINAAKGSDLLSERIQKIFGARFVYSDKEHQRFRDRLEKEPGIQKIFDGGICSLYQIERSTVP